MEGELGEGASDFFDLKGELSDALGFDDMRRNRNDLEVGLDRNSIFGN